jgi:hypothetical protein
MKYAYTFNVWPDETRDFSQAIFDVFRLIKPRIEMHFTEAEFEQFRSDLNHQGFTLRAIVRVPYTKPEVIL